MALLLAYVASRSRWSSRQLSQRQSLADPIGMLENTAIDAVGFVGVLDPEVLNPRPLVRGRRMLPLLIHQIVLQDVHCGRLFENLGGPGRLEGASRMHRNGGDALINSVRQNFRTFPL